VDDDLGALDGAIDRGRIAQVAEAVLEASLRQGGSAYTT
jgi:hypothetical protein